MIERYHSPELDQMLGTEIKVLDKGFIKVIEYMGNDSLIVDSARLTSGSVGKVSDRNLIRYLMRHRHTTPFEMCEILLHVKVPMDCWRQWIRHRTASVNEYSTRYSEAINDDQDTPAYEWRLQAKSNRQGSDGYIDNEKGEYLTKREGLLHAHSYEIYTERLRMGVAREQARKDLPLSTYTEAFWKMDLHNLFHFLGLRLDTHAQLEIRQYAQAIGRIVNLWVPHSAEAFADYVLNCIHLTYNEQQIVSLLSNNDAENFARATILMHQIQNKREQAECIAKLKSLGFASIIGEWSNE